MAGLDQISERRLLARWSKLADRADTMPPAELQTLRDAAEAQRLRLDRLISAADRARARPEAPPPQGTDWHWRPEPWRAPLRPAALSEPVSGTAFGSEVTIYHDASRPAFLLRQGALAGHGRVVTLSAFDLDGSYLSLAMELPAEAAEGLTQRHILRVDPALSGPAGLEAYARLNIRHGPNTEEIVRQIATDGSDQTVEFDLAYTQLNERRVERLWLDLILNGATMARVEIADLRFSRRRRAEV